ncbi:MAG: efflux RND transporter permease subunit, partial [Tepidisphaeraceae bacterium]
PAVRVEVNPRVLNNLGLGLDTVRNALNAANANAPKGSVANDRYSWTISTTDQLFTADQYRSLVIAYHDGSPVRLSEVANVIDSVEDIRNAGMANGKPSVSLILFRQPNANIISTVDAVKTILPQLQASIPPPMHLAVIVDRTLVIQASVTDTLYTLLMSVGLVIAVVFVFLRNVRSTLIPSVAVPISLIGTFGVMWLCGYSLDILSLMALTIATGFVVDDAIVVVENISRHIEEGVPPLQASLQGAKEIGFTVLSISVSLVAVFIPILLMGGYIGRLFREFAIVLSAAIGVSLVVSLTTTPMMSALLLRSHDAEKHGWLYRLSERAFDAILHFYEVTLAHVLRHPLITLLVTLGTVGLSVYLYVIVPKGFFPSQDTGRIGGSIVADQSTSFAKMKPLLQRYMKIVRADPAVANVVGYTGGGSINTGHLFVGLKPLNERGVSVDEVIDRLRKKVGTVPGASLYFVSYQDVKVGGRSSAAQYQYTLQSDSFSELAYWAQKLRDKMRTLPGVEDVNADLQNGGLEADLVIDRAAAARLKLTPAAIDSALYDAFGQRQVSTMYTALNQYHVVMEVDPELALDPSALQYVYVTPTQGAPVPLSEIARYVPGSTSLAVNHQGFFPSITLSFNLEAGKSLGDAVAAINRASQEINIPASINGTFAGTAAAFQSSLATQPYLIAAALIAVYIVLGVLYESYIIPITILSTLPSAGVGALLALLLFHTDLSLIALIGIILLIGIVKKNAIMMVDFALQQERGLGKSPRDAIFEACLLRFRPIMMTTMAALLGGLPLARGHGVGAELRRPLGIAIVGGLVFSQVLTLYTTPVVYLYLDRLRHWASARRAGEPKSNLLPEGAT